MPSNVSTITITFTENLPIGAQLGFAVNNSGGPWGVPTTTYQIFNWVNLRSSNNQVTTGVPTDSAGERDAINFVTAFNLDNPGLFSVSRNLNVVTITATNIDSLREFFVGGFFPPYNNHPSIQFEINNSSTLFGIETVEFVEASTAPCSTIGVLVTTSELATQIISPTSVEDNTENPFYFEIGRGLPILIRCQNADGLEDSRSITTPLMMSPNIFFQINNSPNGATVIISYPYPSELVIEYSLDGIAWQESNVFNGLPSGNYTAYVRDQYGCQHSKEFLIDDIGLNSPFFYISKSMSIRFANRIIWGDAGNYKTDENTLSFEVDAKCAHCDLQRFQSADVIRTQFLSNYGERIATVIRQNGEEIDVPIQKLTDNIGLKDRRDARKYDLGNGHTGVYFINGSTYDFDSGAVIGNYTLNGALPEWAQVGKYFAMDLAWFLIEDIIFDESKNADVIVISNVYSGPDILQNVRAIYNRFEYEIYEFSIDMIDYLDEKIQVRIKNNDANFPELTHLSEYISVKVRHEDTLEIKYRNGSNTDVVYATGIENLLRIPYTSINGSYEEENENYKTDTNAVLLNSEMYEIDEFVFEPLTKELWRKLCQALSHEFVFIDGVGYTKNDEFDTEGPLDDSNLYVLKATMVKNGNVYNSSGVIDSGYGASPIEIPGFIETDTNGFVRY